MVNTKCFFPSLKITWIRWMYTDLLIVYYSWIIFLSSVPFSDCNFIVYSHGYLEKFVELHESFLERCNFFMVYFLGKQIGAPVKEIFFLNSFFTLKTLFLIYKNLVNFRHWSQRGLRFCQWLNWGRWSSFTVDKELLKFTLFPLTI